uniref:Ig-like domain-containing protein n=1 Tax=Xiphophorus couchianus TaxID=32473 RepID=A0A3B5KVW6_9TELE
MKWAIHDKFSHCFFPCLATSIRYIMLTTTVTAFHLYIHSTFIISMISSTFGESLETKRPRLVAAMAGDDVVLPCHLGVTVNPDELVVEWGRLDLNPRFVFMWFEGSENVNEKNIAYKGRTSVFTDRLRDGDVSLRLTAVKHSDNGRFRCYNPRDSRIFC